MRVTRVLPNKIKMTPTPASTSMCCSEEDMVIFKIIAAAGAVASESAGWRIKGVGSGGHVAAERAA